MTKIKKLFLLTLCLMGGAYSFAYAETLAQQKLDAILQDEKKLFIQWDKALASGDELGQKQYERKVMGLNQAYQAYIKENQQDIQGWVLYGKLLRKVGQLDQAQAVFLKADELFPDTAVIKQQLGNYFAETGAYPLALACLLNAIDLAPQEAVYHYQVGEVLAHFKDSFVKENILTEAALDKQMQEAFLQAITLAPEEKAYLFRYAESFYDLSEPRWDEALSVWNSLLDDLSEGQARDLVLLQLSRVKIEIGDFEGAQADLAKIYDPELELPRRALLESINERREKV